MNHSAARNDLTARHLRFTGGAGAFYNCPEANGNSSANEGARKKKGTILIAETQEILGELHLLSTDAYNAPAKKTERDVFRSSNPQRLPAGVQ